jgi:endonuclease YncB( thermonuclease family)
MKLSLSNKSRNKIVYWILIIILITVLGLEEGTDTSLIIKSLTQTHKPGYVDVIKVDDGDTITVMINDNTEKIRFIGVDTPETHHPKKPVQCFGKAAQLFTETLIGNKQVQLVADPKDDDRDLYNRLLRYVYLPDGTLINSEIIASGYGFAYTIFPYEKKDEFKKLEHRAREQKLGLWDKCTIDESDHTKETYPESSYFRVIYTYG